jgi:acetolactate synthase-1/2/3 large subunit
MLREHIEAADARAYRAAAPGADAQAMADLAARLAACERPLMLVGGGGWTAQAVADIQAFAERFDLPTGATFRCQDRFDNTHRCYAGDVGIGLAPKLGARLREADLLLVVGARLGEMTTQGYTLPTPPTPHAALVHVHPDPEELGRVYHPALPICAGVGAFVRAAACLEPPATRPWSDAPAAAHADYLAWLEPTPGMPGTLDMGAIMAHLRERLPPEAILTTDAGNFSGWMHRHYVYRRYPTQLGPTNGAMGYGIPAAIAARLAHPDRPAIAFCGDGGALMSGQELATAVQHGIDPVILLINNNMFGTIRMHQERDYPGRTVATDLTNPDFAAWARSFGAHGETVERTEQFPEALERALNGGKAAVLELRIDPDIITTRTTLSAMRAR